MTAKVTFHRLAERELNEAVTYYNLESAGLGGAFLKEIQHRIRSILDYPEAGLVLTGSIRRRLVGRFPYGVVYSIKPKQVRVLAVMHLKRRPMYWTGRR